MDQSASFGVRVAAARSTRTLAVMRSWSHAFVLLSMLGLAACEPLNVRELSITTDAVAPRPLPAILEPVAAQFELAQAAAPNSGSIRFYREWPQVENDHPQSISLALELEAALGQ